MSTDNNSPIPRDFEGTYRTEHRAATRTLLLETVTSSGGDRKPSRRRRMAVAAAVGAVLAGGGTIAYAQFIDSAPVADTGSIRCYSEVSTEFGTRFPGIALVAAEGEPLDRGQAVTGGIGNPVEQCRHFWSTGIMKKGSNEVPPLVECVLPDGTAAIFPGDPTTCADLGLPLATTG